MSNFILNDNHEVVEASDTDLSLWQMQHDVAAGTMILQFDSPLDGVIVTTVFRNEEFYPETRSLMGGPPCVFETGIVGDLGIDHEYSRFMHRAVNYEGAIENHFKALNFIDSMGVGDPIC